MKLRYNVGDRPPFGKLVVFALQQLLTPLKTSEPSGFLTIITILCHSSLAPFPTGLHVTQF